MSENMTHRVVFMGTPQFAVPALEILFGNYQVVGVVTQPDRPSGRGRKIRPSPVRALAARHGVTVLQPRSLQEPGTVDRLRAWQADVIVVAAFGQLLPSSVLNLPPNGCVNVHASLLPRWRGAAPVAAAILAGDEVTGITLMKMDAGLDTGPILKQASLAIEADDTRESLTVRLSQLGAELLRDSLPDWLAGRIEPQAQDDSAATHAAQVTKEQGHINWHQPADEIARKVRAFHPWPGTFTNWRGNPLKIVRATAVPDDLPSAPGLEDNEQASPVPGTVIAGPSGPEVITGKGLLLLLEVQPPGKRPMSAAAFARGARDFAGSMLT